MTDGEILKNFVTPGHRTAFSGVDRVSKYYGISKQRARQVLESSHTYSLFKQTFRPKQFNPYYLYRRRELVQTDLIDVRALSEHNSGVKYILVLIDCFTKKLWAKTMLTKRADEMSVKLREWLENDIRGRRVKTLSHDQGLEYCNRQVRQLLDEFGVKQQVAAGTSKAAIAERMNKTLQSLIYQYLSETQQFRYVDVLPKLVHTYNTRAHRTLDGMTPNKADLPRNELLVRGIHMQRYAKITRRQPRLALGDVVRIKLSTSKLSPAARSYAEKFKGEYFVIQRINRRLSIPMYYLKSLNDQTFLEQPFYFEELSPIRSDEYRIERVLNWRGRGANRQALVRWLDFPHPNNDAWIPAKNITRIFRQQ